MSGSEAEPDTEEARELLGRLLAFHGAVTSEGESATSVLTDAELSGLTAAQRAELLTRLSGIDDRDLFSAGKAVERRRFVFVLTACCLVMIPWVAVLAVRLPPHYTTGHWTLTWVGFDVGLSLLLALTAWTAWRRAQLFVLTATVTATLLVCDAWFDVTTAAGRADVMQSIAAAVLIELPLAAVLSQVGRRLFRDEVRRGRALAGERDSTQPLWKQSLVRTGPSTSTRK